MNLEELKNLFSCAEPKRLFQKQSENHILDKGLPPKQVEEWLQWMGVHIHGWKFGWTTWLLVQGTSLIEKTSMLRDKGIEVCLGGTAGELALAGDFMSEYVTFARKLGVSTIEIGSNQSGSDPLQYKDTIRLVRDSGLDCNFELGLKLVSENDLNSSYWTDFGHSVLSWGANRIVLEARESARCIGLYDEDGQIRPNSSVWLDEFCLDTLLVEAPDRTSQISALKFFSENVNLSNIQIDELLRVETMRRGVHSEFI